MDRNPRLLLVGWEIHHPRLLDDALRLGFLPHLKALLGQSAAAPIHIPAPRLTPVTWTSLLTGRFPDQHRILGPQELSDDGLQFQPVSRFSLCSPPLWNEVHRSGLIAHAVGWPASHPAPETGGVSVSDLFPSPQSVHPTEAVDALTQLSLSPTEIDNAAVEELFASSPENVQGPCAHAARRFIAETATAQAQITWAMDREPWNLAAVQLSGLPTLLASLKSVDVGKQLITVSQRSIQFLDRVLGRLLELAGDDASVALISLPLAATSPPRSNGLAVLRADGVKPGWRTRGPALFDIMPTLLTWLGVPVADDLPGRAWPDALPRGGQPTFKPGIPADRREAILPPTTGQRSVEHLISAGYQEVGDPALENAISRLEAAENNPLSQALTEQRRYDRAVEALEKSVALNPTSVLYRSAIAEAYFFGDRRADCRRAIESLLADKVETPLAYAGLAALSLSEGNRESATAFLEEAALRGTCPSSVDHFIGWIYLRLRSFDEAHAAFERAAAEEPGWDAPAASLAALSLLGADAVGAEKHARRAIALAPGSGRNHQRLGIALERQDRRCEAVEALLAALRCESAPATSIHAHLAKLYGAMGQAEAAAAHHAIAFQRRLHQRANLAGGSWFGIGSESGP